MNVKKPITLILGFLLLSTMAMYMASTSYAAPKNPLGLLDPKTIPKFVNELTGPPPVYVGSGGSPDQYAVDVKQFMQQILPSPLPMTTVWGYGGEVKDAVTGVSLGIQHNAPGPTFEATRGTPIQVTWTNNLVDLQGDPLSHLFPVDPTLHWADPNGVGMPTQPFNPYPPGYATAQSPVPLIPHLHGGEVQSTSDGHPEAWFTYDGTTGDSYNTLGSPAAGSAIFSYPNEQPPTTLWYHDHALGITRINVLSGLAGFYLLRDPNDLTEIALANAGIGKGTKYDMPLVIQDRTFYQDGSFFFDTVGLNPTIHPYWMPEFFGNTIMVNGKVWPNMNVDKGLYRLRLLEGSNARFYTLSFDAGKYGTVPFTVIGSDGGYLQTPVAMTQLTMAPGERVDILIDFSALPTGTKVLLKNTARAPFPGGAPADPKTVGQVMQFSVTANTGVASVNLPTTLNPTLPTGTWPTITDPVVKTRILTLVEVMGAGGPVEILLDGQKWSAAISEEPQLGTTEEWVIVNPTADTHPIHLHLVQFQLVQRQAFQVNKFMTTWAANNPVDPLTGMAPLTGPTAWPGNDATGITNLAPFLQKKPVGPASNEMGWKDTIQMNPGEVTTILVRFKPIDSDINPTAYPYYPFDPTVGPGYVWHCHILDHEDNEMMRPYKVAPVP
jgi:spore coat protein A